MKYEVEQKHPVEDIARIEQELAERGVKIGPAQIHRDSYYNHPSRDYAQTDEALRIRCIGETNFVTYKGPKIDQTSKTRQEIEIPIPPGKEGASQFTHLLGALKFTIVATVTKTRREFHIEFEGELVTGTIDEVDGVGTFAEIELIADEQSLEQAKQVISQLAEELGLGPSERRSYLEMLLDG